MIKKIEKIKRKINVFISQRMGKINFNFSEKKKRWQLINEIINKKNYKSYLEIGCFNNDCFSKINIEKKTGVDPIKGGNIRKTSDDFFLDNKENFDIIFIDGLHTYQQVKKDIKNSIKSLNPGGTIICHDSLPTEYSEQTVPFSQGVWVGDVWKAIVEFRTYQELDVCTCDIDHGLGIIKVRKNTNQLNLIKKNYKNLTYSFYFENYLKIMNIKNYSESLNFIF